MDIISVSTESRSQLGRKSSRAARREGQIPCVLYGTKEPIHFSVTPGSVKKLIYTPEFRLAELDIDGTTYRAIVKDVQFLPVRDGIQHIDFLALEDGRSVRVALPVQFVGVSPGVLVGGKLQQLLRRIKVKTTPEHLIDKLTLDISDLKLGHSIRVRDIEVKEGIQIMSAGATPVAIVETPRALRSAEAGAVGADDADGDEAEDDGEEGGDEASE